MNKGITSAFAAYFLWGILPIYWKLLAHVPAVELLQHRVVWLLFTAFILIRNRKRIARLLSELLQKRGRVFWLTGLLLGLNWLLFIWAITNDHIVEASLGYFINPLVNVVLGVVLLKEKLRPIQWLAIMIAATGVIYLTFAMGTIPWIALLLAFSFAAYGLLRKRASRGAIDGLLQESAVMSIPGFLAMFYDIGSQQGVLFSGHVQTLLLLPLSGILTALPLLFFNYGARHIPFSMLGILQYVAPTLQFLLGVFLYNEAFGNVQLIGYSMIWSALAIYTLESLVIMRFVKQVR